MSVFEIWSSIWKIIQCVITIGRSTRKIWQTRLERGTYHGVSSTFQSYIQNFKRRGVSPADCFKYYWVTRALTSKTLGFTAYQHLNTPYCVPLDARIFLGSSVGQAACSGRMVRLIVERNTSDHCLRTFRTVLRVFTGQSYLVFHISRGCDTVPS